MSAQVAAHGRLGADPVQRASQTGNIWATASLAVTLAGEREAPAQWFGIVAFGRIAESLCRHAKGDLISVAGQLQSNRRTDREGNEREGLQIVADAIVSAKAVRQGGGRRRLK
ncbi:MAG: single-stranded DNA-binding protein [Stutzerimonas stutzeri]|nr:MAG: single-stranded DNA-binding protein [Stutzerimonas stutzeri]